MRHAEDGVGIADAVRVHMYRKWPTKESRKWWERGTKRRPHKALAFRPG
jgi:hypothetical protein